MSVDHFEKKTTAPAAMTGNAIREALEPFAKAADGYAPSVPDSDFARVKWFSVGDLRRARTTHTAAGAGPVGEAVADFVGWLSEVDERGVLGDKLARLTPIAAARQVWSAALSYARPVDAQEAGK